MTPPVAPVGEHGRQTPIWVLNCKLQRIIRKKWHHAIAAWTPKEPNHGKDMFKIEIGLKKTISQVETSKGLHKQHWTPLETPAQAFSASPPQWRAPLKGHTLEQQGSSRLVKEKRLGKVSWVEAADLSPFGAVSADPLRSTEFMKSKASEWLISSGLLSWDLHESKFQRVREKAAILLT